MRTLALMLLLSFPAAAQTRVFILDFTSEVSSNSELEAMEQRVSEGVADRPDLVVTTGDELRELIDLESERQELGCDDDSTECLSEVAGAFGARFVLTGRVSRVGELFVVQLAIINTRDATTIARRSVEGVRITDVFAQLRAASTELVSAIATPALRAPPGWTATGHVGVGILVAGAVAASVGAWPALSFALEQEQLSRDVARFEGEATPSAVDTVVATRARLDAASADWNSWGLITASAGAGLVAAGLIVAVTGYGAGAALAVPEEVE